MFNVLVYGLTVEAQRSNAHEGVKAMAWLYYDNFADATELEPGFVAQMHGLARYLEMGFDEDDIDAAIREAEKELRADGRPVHTAGCDADDD